MGKLGAVEQSQWCRYTVQKSPQRTILSTDKNKDTASYRTGKWSTRSHGTTTAATTTATATTARPTPHTIPSPPPQTISQTSPPHAMIGPYRLLLTRAVLLTGMLGVNGRSAGNGRPSPRPSGWSPPMLPSTALVMLTISSGMRMP